MIEGKRQRPERHPSRMQFPTIAVALGFQRIQRGEVRGIALSVLVKNDLHLAMRWSRLRGQRPC
jgi:hypothetical protein